MVKNICQDTFTFVLPDNMSMIDAEEDDATNVQPFACYVKRWSRLWFLSSVGSSFTYKFAYNWCLMG